jgi:hypothetical protein
MVSPPPPGAARDGFGTPQNAAEQEFVQGTSVTGAFKPADAGTEGLVWMGPKWTKGDGMVTMDVASNFWFKIDNATRAEYIKKMEEAYGTRITSAPQALNQWKGLIQTVGAYEKALGDKISPDQILDQFISMNIAKATGGGGASGYSKVVDLTNPDDAQVLVNNSLNQYLGRDATDDERDVFLKTLNAVERKNPIVTTPSSRSGGTNEQQVAKEFALSRDTAAEDAVNSTYMGWMADLLMKNPTEGVESGL